MTRHKELGEDLLESLISFGIVNDSNNGQIRFTDGFQQAREEHRMRVHELDDAEFEAQVHEVTTEISPSALSPGVLGDVMALSEFSTDLTEQQLFSLALFLDNIREPEYANGVPIGFLSIDGEDIELFLELFPAAVVYCWREDCDPCDLVKEDFENLISAGKIPPEVGLGAVYGPDCATLLQEKYNVKAAPTMLFCLNGEIDSRYIGAKTETALLAEIEHIAESAGVSIDAD